MRFKIQLACFALLQACLIAFSPSYGAEPDEIIVHFRDRSQSARLSQAQTVQSLDATTVRKIPNHGNIVLLKKSRSRSMDDLLRRLRRNPDVVSAEPNVVVQIPDPEPDTVLSADEAAVMFSTAAEASVAGLPSDPLLTWGYGDIEADLVPPAPGEAPMVAVVDTGVDYTHPELAGRVVLGHDFHNDDDDPMDDHGHGTHVSGIVAAEANNGQGSAGVSPGSRILAVKVLGSNGSGSMWSVAQGIYAAADHPDVGAINISLGSIIGTGTLLDAIRYAAEDKGKLVAVAAGNSDTSQFFYPAVWSHWVAGVVGVAANQEDRCKAWFSNYGDNATISAPGLAIWSTLPGNQYAAWSGTSMATPFVAGAAARLLAEDPSLTNVQLKSLLEGDTDALTFDGDCWPTGDRFGHLNLADALGSTPAPTLDNEPPTLAIESPTNNGSYETEQGSIEIAGTASDNLGVNRVVWTSDRGGSGTAIGTTSWSIADLVLQDGENIVTITAEDSAGNQTDEQLLVTLAPQGTQVLTLAIDEASDDGYEILKNGRTVLTKNRTKIGRNRLVGYHFDNVGIPPNASIVSATLSQYGSRSKSDITIEYTGEAVGYAAAFSGEKFDLSGRARTLEAVTDSPSAWEKKGYYPSPNLAAIVQEIISHPDWQSGHAINIFIEDKGSKKARVVSQFGKHGEQAAILEVRYRLPE